MIEPSERLRRAIQLDSLSLVKRILASNVESQTLLRNYDEAGNTSLHLAAQLGHADIAAHLLHLGHESTSVSRNHADVTPLMLAGQAGDSSSDPTTAGKIAIARLLIKTYDTAALLIKDKNGLDVFAYAAKHGSTAIVQILLALPREPILLELAGAPHNGDQEAKEAATAQAGKTLQAQTPPRRPVSSLHPLLLTTDNLGNTPLHHASAWGHLKVSRLLVDAGLSATTRNTAGWTPIEYSATVAAEVYLRNLMREKLGQLAPERRGNSGTGRAALGALGATGRQASGGIGGSGKSSFNITATMSDMEDDQESRADDPRLGRARTFTG